MKTIKFLQKSFSTKLESEILNSEIELLQEKLNLIRKTRSRR